MTVLVPLPDELIAQIDDISNDRNAFVTEAVRRLLHQSPASIPDEVSRINELADELNREAAEVLEYQVIA